jgi:hypothetical protein
MMRRCVKVMHDRSFPGTRWVSPVGWEADWSWADEDEDLVYEEGTLWSDYGEEYGLAMVTDANEGDVLEVSDHDVFWSSTGDCRYICLAKERKEELT